MVKRYFPHDTLGLWDKITYSSGIIGKNIAHGLIITLIIIYCIQELHLHFSFLLFGYLLSLGMECICALCLGVLFDHAKSNLDKYKNWIIAGTICSITSSVCFFLLPSMFQNLLDLYMTFVFVMINCCFLLIQLPYLALISSFSSNSHTRNLIATMPSVGNFLGRQIIFATLLSLFTHFEFINFELQLYTYILTIAIVILVVSQGCFVCCLHYHKPHLIWSHEQEQRSARFNPQTITLGKAYAQSDNAKQASTSNVTSEKQDTLNSAPNAASSTAQSIHTFESTIASNTEKNTSKATLETQSTADHTAYINQDHAKSSNKIVAYLSEQTGAPTCNHSLSDDKTESAVCVATQTLQTTLKEATDHHDAYKDAQQESVLNTQQDTQQHKLQENQHISLQKNSVACKQDPIYLSTQHEHSAYPTPRNGNDQTVASHTADLKQYDDSIKSAKLNAAAAYQALQNIPNDITSSYALIHSNNHGVYAPYKLLDTAANHPNTVYKNLSARNSHTTQNTKLTEHSSEHLETPSVEYEQSAAISGDINGCMDFNHLNNLKNYEKAPTFERQDTHVAPPSGAYNQNTSVFSALTLNNLIYSFIKNDQLMIMFLIASLQYANFSMITSLLSYFFIENKILNNALSASFLVIGAATQLISMLCFPFLASRFNRTNVFINASLWSGIAFILHFIIQSSPLDAALYFLPIMYIIINIGMGLSKVAMTTMVADTVDYGEFKLSQRSDAFVFAYFTSAYRIGSFIAFGLFFAKDMSYYITPSMEEFVPMPIERILEIFLICIMIISALLIYKYFYKLNGAFYRNILNNLQFLRQNQSVYKTKFNFKQHFMLRYSLDANAMLIKLKAKNESEVIQAMVQKLSEVNAITSEHDYMYDLKRRLEIGPCGIAEGIAIPHAKSSAVKRATVVVATLDSPIDLGALDEQKCDLIFLLASPDDGVTHMNLLGRLSLLLNEPGFADRLRASGSPSELFERLIRCEKNIVN